MRVIAPPMTRAASGLPWRRAARPHRHPLVISMV